MRISTLREWFRTHRTSDDLRSVVLRFEEQNAWYLWPRDNTRRRRSDERIGVVAPLDAGPGDKDQAELGSGEVNRTGPDRGSRAKTVV